MAARWAERLRPYIADTHPLIQEALRADRMILLEGQLGVMRDLDWGLYPYVTSSTTLPGGASSGAGIPPYRITRVLGVAKAYTTAVGSGPMPTELEDETGARIRELGAEYGATTRRPRRCGWFDGVAARFAAEVAGFTQLAVMKLDIFDTFETIKIAAAYRLGGRTIHSVPHTAAMARVEPVYEELRRLARAHAARAAPDGSPGRGADVSPADRGDRRRPDRDGRGRPGPAGRHLHAGGVPVIPRYTSPEMAALWSPEAKFNTWLEIELLAAEAQAERGLVPRDAARRLRERARVTSVARIDEIEEKETRHDVVAFLRVVGETVGDDARYLHLGLGSSDVVDTALSVLMVRAADLLDARARGPAPGARAPRRDATGTP